MKNDTASRAPLLLEGIQYLRGIAALMVVFHHARNEFGGAMSVTLGARGVEIFFVISGLVMMYSTRGGVIAGKTTFLERVSASVLFWKRRFLRVAPLYWIALLLSAQFVSQVGFIDPLLLKDALFIPHWNQAFTDEIWPTLVPGWSLNYEMFFYFLFGLSLLFSRYSVKLLCASIFALCALRLAFESNSAVFLFYTSSVMFHFIAGVLLYYVIELMRQRPAWIPSRWILCMALLAGFAGLGISPAWAGAFWLLLPTSLIVVAAVFLFDGIRLPVCRLLGDASYSIYLFHLLVFTFTHQAITWSGLAAVSKWEILANFAIYVSTATLAGVAIHLAIEKPLTQYMAGFVRRKAAAPVAAR